MPGAVKFGPIIDLDFLPMASTGERYKFARIITDADGKEWVAVSMNTKHWSPGTPETKGTSWQDPEYESGTVRPVNWGPK